jgi:hypothetical protein
MIPHRVLNGSWLLWQMLCVAVVWQAGYAALAYGLCIAVLVVFPRTRIGTPWQVVLGGSLTLLVFVVPSAWWTASSSIAPDGLARWLPPLGASLLVWQIVVWAGRDRTIHVPGWFLSLGIGVLYCVYSGTSSIGRRNEMLMATAVSLVLFSLLARTLTQPLLRPRHVVSAVNNTRTSRWRIVGVLVSAALLSWPFSQQLAAQIQFIQGWVAEAVMMDVTHVRSTRSYVRVANLRSVLNEQTQNPTQVALRVFSQRAPGYLRGRVYDRYRAGQWTMYDRTQGPRWNRLDDKRIVTPVRQIPLEISKTDKDTQLFAVQPLAEGPWTRMEIWNDPLRGEFFFLPLGTAFVEGTGEYLAVDANQVVRTGITTSRPYAAYVPRLPARERLARRDGSRWLDVPNRLTPEVQRLADELGRGRLAARDKIMAVSDFFQQNFRYSLAGVVVPQSEDPVEFFLRTKPAAHCEFFASAAATLLRTMDVPARYVTGYVVREASEYGDYWIARNYNAHAWVEAYDDQAQRWRIVEATPGMQASNSNTRTLILDSQSGENQGRLQRVLQIGRYWLEPRWRQVWLEAFIRRVQWPLATLMVGAAVAMLVRQQGWRCGRSSKDGSEPLRGARFGQLRRWERRLRRHGYERHPAETLHQFALRLDAAAADNTVLAEAAIWIREYAKRRYAPLPANPRTTAGKRSTGRGPGWAVEN